MDERALRLECLRMASEQCAGTAMAFQQRAPAKEILELAKAYYAFVSNEKG